MKKIIKVPVYVRSIMDKLEKDCLHEAYIVGGAVRDSIMGIEPSDWDVFTDATGEEILEYFPGCKVIGDEERQSRILTVIVPSFGHDLEVSTYRKSGDRKEIGTNIVDHLKTCDYTVNAVACDKFGHIFDPINGVDDIEFKVLKFVGDPINRIDEDPLRILRGFRFHAMGFYPSVATKKAWWTERDMVEYMSEERMLGEVNKAFGLDKPSKFIRDMYKYKILDWYIPELARGWCLPQNPKYHPEGNIGEHTCKVVDSCVEKYRPHALLHDIGKSVTAELHASGEYYSFKGHEKEGADMILDIAKSLKIPLKIAKEIEVTTRLHMRPHQATTKRAIRRFHAEAGEYMEAVYEVCKADVMDRKHFHADVFIPLPDEVVKIHHIDGEYLKAKGYTEGKQLGKVKAECYELQLHTGLVVADEIYYAWECTQSTPLAPR